MESRVIFEKWAEREGFDLLKYSSTGVYQSTDTRAAWETWAKRQPEIDALKFDRMVLRSLYSNASREISRLQEVETALRAEVEKLRARIGEMLDQTLAAD